MGDFRTAFPEIDPASMPDLPDGFKDDSWRNDACPCYTHGELGLVIWLDYPDPADSDFPESRADGTRKRFCLDAFDEDQGEGVWSYGDGADPQFQQGRGLTICDSDDWADILGALAWANLAEFFEDRAEVCQTAANHAAGTSKGARLQAVADGFKARAALIYERGEG